MNTENNSNPGIEEALQGDAEDTGSDSFFDTLDNQVNGQILDDDLSTQPETEQATQQYVDSADTDNEEVDWQSEAENLQQRYSDSSREAQRLKQELDGASQYSQYAPLINHLQNDPASVQALRDHISGESNPAEQFGEDFIFDGQEAITDPKSDSAKALRAMIDREADNKVNQRLSQEEQKNQQALNEYQEGQRVQDFMKRSGMDEDQMVAMQDWADTRELTIDDIYYLMNKEQSAQNIANNTKQEMLGQMKAVRNIPTSASNANSAPDQRSPDDAVFDILKGMDEGAENLFG
tara:strand:- start:1315 stop:2193 length:879 start_codon:yes stop_codon:yes gene_type:complete